MPAPPGDRQQAAVARRGSRSGLVRGQHRHAAACQMLLAAVLRAPPARRHRDCDAGSSSSHSVASHSDRRASATRRCWPADSLRTGCVGSIFGRPTPSQRALQLRRRGAACAARRQSAGSRARSGRPSVRSRARGRPGPSGTRRGRARPACPASASAPPRHAGSPRQQRSSEVLPVPLGHSSCSACPARQREAQAAQQVPVAAPEVQVTDFEHVSLGVHGADGGTRTHTPFRKADFKSAASTSFATSATGQYSSARWRLGSESNRRTRLCRPLHDHSAT